MKWELIVQSGELALPVPAEHGIRITDSLVDVMRAPNRIGLPSLDMANCEGGDCLSSILLKLLNAVEDDDRLEFSDEFCLSELGQEPYCLTHPMLRKMHMRYLESFGFQRNATYVEYERFAGYRVRHELYERAFRLWLLLRAGYRLSFIEV